MPAYLSPVGNSQESDANGAPLVGGAIHTYAAGTSTPIATYTGSDGLTAQANPVVLNASGLPDSPIWLPAGQAVKMVIKDADGVTLRTVDNLTGINDPAGIAAASEWVTYTGEPTYISATSFSVEGDQTGTFQVSRRLRCTNTGGTVYSTITASSYNAGTALTTVTVANDSGTLDAGLSAVAYGLLSASNPSAPLLGTVVAAGGTVSAITATVPGAPAANINGTRVQVRASGANTSATPTFALNGATAKTVVKGNAAALVAGDIGGASHVMDLLFDSTADKWVLLNALHPAPAGTVLQKITFAVDAGSTTSSTGSAANVSASSKVITPRSANSIIQIRCAFQAIVSLVGGVNTVATFILLESGVVSGSQYTFGVNNGSGGNRLESMASVSGRLSNAAITPRSFTLGALVNNASAIASGLSQYWVIEEIQA